MTPKMVGKLAGGTAVYWLLQGKAKKTTKEGKDEKPPQKREPNFAI